jgi:hypothetical protein
MYKTVPKGPSSGESEVDDLLADLGLGGWMSFVVLI